MSDPWNTLNALQKLAREDAALASFLEPLIRAAHGEEGESSYMSVKSLNELQDHAATLLGQINADTVLPDWAEALITESAVQLRNVYEYMQHGRLAAEPHPEGMQAESNDIYEKQVDHGYEQPLSGGHDIMKRLQDRLLIEQGREPRETNPRLAATMSLQEGLIKLLHSPAGRDRVRQAVSRYAAETNTIIIVNAAVDDILHHAVAVALDPQKMGAVIAKHTVPDAS